MHVVFSGVDGAGKSTQINLLIDALQGQGKRTTYLWTRGGYTPFFNAFKEGVRRVFAGKAVPTSGPSKQRDESLRRPAVRKVWLALAILELYWIYGIQIRWWQSKKKVVICDRYLDDTVLDFRRNFPQENVAEWWLWKGLQLFAARPDVTFLLLVPVVVSIERSQQKDEPFPDSPETLRWRLAQYEILAQQRQWQVLDGQQPVADVAATIHKTVVDLFDAQPMVITYAD